MIGKIQKQLNQESSKLSNIDNDYQYYLKSQEFLFKHTSMYERC